MRGKKKTTEDFITDAIAVHGNKYSYDKVKYVKNNIPVVITCPKHGDFPMLPNNHTSNKNGCPKCARENNSGRLPDTLEEFIAKARAIHGDKYNYDKVEYKGDKKKVIITCPIHGDFPQTPHNHKKGKGCPWCKKEKLSKLYIDTKEEFIAKARAVHGSKYNYDKVKYKGSNEKVTITCPIHGDFPMTPNNHKLGRGCPWCAGNKKKTTEEFIKDARAVHGDRYNYDKLEYRGIFKEIIITCPKHGDFPQVASYHLHDRCGCPKCNQSHLEREVSLTLDKHNIKYESEKTFPWLKNKREMPLDFYIPIYNVAIECQGIQHYEATGGVFTKEKVEYTQKNDKLKYQLCQEHGISIHYVKYNENVKENIEKLIKELNNITY